jgi:hypothetical protein
VSTSIATPYRARKYDRKLDHDAEAQLLKLTCSEPPEEHSCWTPHLLADELVILGDAVRERLKMPETASL